MASSSVTRGSTVTLTGFPLIVSVIATGPGPATLAGGGAAAASRSSRLVPTAPLPRPTPRMNPRRENPAGSFLELTHTFLSSIPAVVLDVPGGEIESTKVAPGPEGALLSPVFFPEAPPAAKTARAARQ